MATKNRPGHGEKKAAAKSLKEKRVEKRMKRAAHQIEGNRPVEKTFSHAH
ncbi:MAG TPA: hypothetical protein VIW46_13785 [Acidimicrobiia bacterium]|jgi:hypothetical protein